MTLPLVVLAGVSSSEQVLLCRMDGYTRSCCCPHEARTSSDVAFERPSCCQGVDSSIAPAPTAEQRQTQTLAKHQATQLVVHLPSTAMPASELADAIFGAPRADGPRRATGPPIYIRHRALLI